MHTSKRDIIKAQKWLKALGSSVQVNGQMTIGLARALYCFQKKNYLPTTGDLDEVTWKALKRANSPISKLVEKIKKRIKSK